MTAPKPPDTEQGDPGNLRPTWTIAGTRKNEAVSADPNIDLQFPWSVPVFDRMAKTDGKVGAVLRSITLPLYRARWDLNTEGCRPEVVQRVREDLGLPAVGQQLPRKRASKVVWTEHLREALRSLVHGFAVFEQVYTVTDGPLGQEVHLKKLAPRLAPTIERILVAPDGMLEAVVQKPSGWGMGPNGWKPTILPVDRIAVYSHEREGADWYGTSLLRTAYKDWLIKDELVRLNAQIIERNGMGVPIVTYDTTDGDQAKEEALTLAQNFRTGAEAGAALPLGSTLQLIGVTGSTVDPLPTIREHDQNISKAVLAMFLDLGHDAGARSLGDTFVDIFTQSLQHTADWIAATASEFIVRDLVDWAFGPDEPHPLITAGDIASDQADISAEDLARYVDSGIIQVDEDLERNIRQRRGLPKPGNRPLTDRAAARLPIEQRVNQPIAPVVVEPVSQVLTSEEIDSLGARAMKLVKRLGKSKDDQ